MRRLLIVLLWLLAVIRLSHSDTTSEALTALFDGKVPKNAIKQFSPGGQYILLTFSGGPHKELTQDILTILRNASVHGTFFVTGQRVLNHPKLLQAIIKDQHDLGHSGFYSMVQLSRKSKEDISAQISSAASLLKNVTQKDSRFFRPPGYFISDALSDWITDNSANTKTVLWSIDLNYLLKDQKKSVEEVASLLRARAKPGDVINCVEARSTVKALPAIIEALKAERYEFLTLTEVFSFPDDSPH